MANDNPELESLSFLEVVSKVDGGGLAKALDEEQKEVIEAVQDSNKKGSIKLELKFDPNGSNQLQVETKIKTKKPRRDRPATFFYTDQDHRVYRKDPTQLEMDLQQLPEEQRNVRRLSGTDGE